MRFVIWIALSLASTAVLRANEGVAAKPLWSAKLEGAGPAPLWADANRVIVSDDVNGTPNYRGLRFSDGSELWVTDSESAKNATGAPANAAKPFVLDNIAYLQFASGDFFYQYLSGGTRDRDAWNVAERFDARKPLKGYAASPLIYDGKLFVMPGAQNASIVALHLVPGDEIWKTPGRRASRSDFIAGEFGGVKQLIGFDHDSLGGWAADSGKRLWQIDTPDRVEDAIETLFETRGQLLASTSDGVAALYAFNANGGIAEKPVTRNADAKGRIKVLANRVAIGIVDGSVYALNLDDDLRECWRLSEAQVADPVFLMLNDARLFVFSSDGTLTVFELGVTKAERLGAYKLCDSIVARPAIAAGRLFVRAATHLDCFELNAMRIPKKQ